MSCQDALRGHCSHTVHLTAWDSVPELCPHSYKWDKWRQVRVQSKQDFNKDVEIAFVCCTLRMTVDAPWWPFLMYLKVSTVLMSECKKSMKEEKTTCYNTFTHCLTWHVSRDFTSELIEKPPQEIRSDSCGRLTCHSSRTSLENFMVAALEWKWIYLIATTACCLGSPHTP